LAEADEGEHVRQDHPGVPEQVAVPALGVLPSGAPGDAGEDEDHRGPGDGGLRGGCPDEMASGVALADAGKRAERRVEVEYAGGKAGEVRAGNVDLHWVQGAGRGVVPEVDELPPGEPHRVVHASADH
jgi:hypothetical protein